MYTHLISYDLRAPHRDYTALYAGIFFHTRNAKRMTESVWLVTYGGTATQLRDALLRYIDENDRLIVIEVGQGATWNCPASP